MFWKNLMVGQNLMVGHALLGGWKWSELPCSVIWHLLVIILMHWVFQFWLWGRFVAEKQTWVLILMSGHRPEMTYYENGEKKVCELDHYTDQSYLGIHYWDLVSKVAYPKLKKKLKFKCPDMRNGKDLRRCPLKLLCFPITFSAVWLEKGDFEMEVLLFCIEKSM